MNEIKETFNRKGYLYLQNIVPKEICYFITSGLLLQTRINPNESLAMKKDPQVPNAGCNVYGTIPNLTLLEILWPTIEEVIGEEILPSYTYSRLYLNGNELKKHIDRPSCEISLTIQLGRSHHYAWPIFMDGKRFDLGEGDAILYKGCELPHWREECKGPDNYYSGQVFLHYVRANGPYKEFAGDKNFEKIPYIRNANELMTSK